MRSPLLNLSTLYVYKTVDHYFCNNVNTCLCAHTCTYALVAFACTHILPSRTHLPLTNRLPELYVMSSHYLGASTSRGGELMERCIRKLMPTGIDLHHVDLTSRTFAPKPLASYDLHIIFATLAQMFLIKMAKLGCT